MAEESREGYLFPFPCMRFDFLDCIMFENESCFFLSNKRRKQDKQSNGTRGSDCALYKSLIAVNAHLDCVFCMCRVSRG
jgi:hypothetical protein